MTDVPAFDAKQKLSELLARAAAGEEFVITKHGQPVAKLGPVEQANNREAARAALLSTLRKQAPLGLPRFTRDDAYEP